MKWFRRKPRPPLAEAIRKVHEAIEIAWRYKRDRLYMPGEEDIRLLCHLTETLWDTHATAQYIAITLRQRANGEQEGAAKFTDEKAFDYHYPP